MDDGIGDPADLFTGPTNGLGAALTMSGDVGDLPIERHTRAVRNTLGDTLRRAMKADGRFIYAVARDAELPVSMVRRFEAGGDLTLRTASKLCALFGLKLVRRGTQ